MPNTDMDKAIDEIQDILTRKKGSLFIDCAQSIKTGNTMSPVDIDEEEKKEVTGARIKTGTVIDDMIGGGIGVGESAMLYGEFACVPTGTWIKVPKRTYSGKYGMGKDYILLKNLNVGDQIISVNMETGEEEEDKILSKTRRCVYKDEPVFEIYTDEGHIIIATGNHPFLTDKGWVNAIDLRVGNHLFASKETPNIKYMKTKPFMYMGGIRGENFRKGGTSWNKGQKMSNEVRQKMSESRISNYQRNPEHFRLNCQRGAIGTRKKLLQTLPQCQQNLLLVLSKMHGYEMEYPVFVGDELIIVDVANVRRKVAIFIDGEYWHKDIIPKDNHNTELLEKAGWDVIRIKNDITPESQDVELLNQTLLDPIITKIDTVKEKWVHDITTKNHTFIANGLVVHNSGKTQVVFTIIALSKNIVVIIDSENTFSFKRLKQICDARGIDYEALKKRLLLYKPKNWLEQLIMARSIPAPEELGENKIDIIICDSLIKYFRGIEFTGRNTLPLKMGFLREFIGSLEDNAKLHKAGIIYTNQVSETPVMTAFSSKADTQMPVGGHSVAHCPTYSLFFRKGSGNIRVVRMMDSSNNELSERAFVINEKGIDDLPKEAEKADLYEKGTLKFEKKQSQEDLRKKKKGIDASEIDTDKENEVEEEQ